MDKSIIRVKNLKKIYNNRIILDVDHLDFQESKIYAIVGPNGSGKTTLLKILNLLEKPDAGQIFFKGQELVNKSRPEVLKIRRKMTLIDQNSFLFHSTVYDNITYGLKVRSVPTKDQRDKVKHALKMGGEAKRVVIARGLVIEPEVFFLDEPTASIDQRHQDVVERIIRNISDEIRTTVILTTHDLSQAYRLADEVVSLLEGRIIKKVPENLFKGVIEEKNGVKYFKVFGNIKFTIAIVSDKVGPAYISIDAKDIVLSYEQFQSSARNTFSGKIIKIIEQNHLVKLEVDVGLSLVTTITRESFQKMNLNLGRKVYLTFKASVVEVY